VTVRGASADALATLSSQLDGAADGGSAEVASTGADLFSVAAVLRAEPALRRLATDVSVAGEAKAGLIDQIFSGKVAATALGLVKTAVAQRWTATRDLADVLEHLGVVATVKSAGDHSGRLSDELFGVGQIVQDNPGLRDALSDPARSAADKRGLVRGLLEGKALPATVSLVEQALAGTHRTVGVALTSYQQVAADVHDQRVAEVRVARPLSDADRQRLGETLSRQYGREVHLNVVVDPDVIGGIRVEIGDDVIDGTVATRLDDARRKLAG
jgi:F-type H+-transporting ATPase subunit delta